jgi:hypothetical protein
VLTGLDDCHTLVSTSEPLVRLAGTMYSQSIPHFLQCEQAGRSAYRGISGTSVMSEEGANVAFLLPLPAACTSLLSFRDGCRNCERLHNRIVEWADEQ